MKTNLLYFFLLFIVLSSCEEQDPELFNKEFLGSDGVSNFVSPDKYRGIPSGKRTSFFLDNFDNNVNEWGLVNTSEVLTTIQGGILIFESRGSAYFFTIPSLLDKNRDFEIETSIKIAKGTDSNINSNGLMWFYELLNGRANSFNRFVFDNSQFSIGKYQSRNYIHWQDWKEEAVNPYSNYNKLTVRKIDNQYYFFVNEKFVLSVPYENFVGNEIGFSVREKGRLEVDYLKIDYIN